MLAEIVDQGEACDNCEDQHRACEFHEMNGRLEVDDVDQESPEDLQVPDQACSARRLHLQGSNLTHLGRNVEQGSDDAQDVHSHSEVLEVAVIHHAAPHKASAEDNHSNDLVPKPNDSEVQLFEFASDHRKCGDASGTSKSTNDAQDSFPLPKVLVNCRFLFASGIDHNDASEADKEADDFDESQSFLEHEISDNGDEQRVDVNDDSRRGQG